ncbi:TlpA family protein disulfide reductase [Sphingobacterium sp. SYP-B4668]|uniref:TlpA family protein disulfide reductase n=1 Tax=Sphingobacterium sp. SYP-B4668 TaxID=2996035 RepID=UPI0022DE617B|nr:redoxin family protein [Sphingobacterium sp. SYP-B4668]
MRSFKIVAVVLFALGHLTSIAQQPKIPDLSQRLMVGDAFVPPASVLLMRGTDSKIDWKALEDKVVLLDLFETTCGTCIQIMPHLQELEKKHSDIFKVLVVTPQDKQTMTDFFNKNKYLEEHQVNLPVIYSDTYIRKLFPYKSIPQAILLYRGKVQAITSSGFVNSDNILSLYREGAINLPLKDDFGRGDLAAAIRVDRGGVKAGVIFSGYQDGVDYQPWRFEQDSLTGLYKSSLYNASMYGTLLSLSSKAKMLDPLFFPRMDRVVWKVADSTRYENFGSPADVWLIDHAISYERYDRKGRPDSIQARIVMDDFERLYGVRVYIGSKAMPCLVLGPVEAIPFDKKGTEVMTYKGTTALSIFLDYGGKFPPAIDEAKKEGMIRLEPYGTLEELNRQLAAYGIKGEIKERDVDVLVIEEVD